MQIYVEIERARLTRKLAKIKEQEGKIKDAAETLQEVAVVWQQSHWLERFDYRVDSFWKVPLKGGITL